MPLLSTFRLEAITRLNALGWPPALAARRAGFRNRTRGRAATGPRTPRAATAPDAEAAAVVEPSRPPLEPMMTEEEWLAEYGPMLRARAAAGAGA